MRNALQRLVAEVPGLATPNDGWIDLQMRKAAQPRHRPGDRRHIGNLIFGQVARFGTRIGQHLLAVAIIQRLRNGECFVSAPAPFLPTSFL